MRRLVLSAVLAAVLSLAAVQVQAAEFSAAQRAEIVSIVRDALKRDPSILRDAVMALQADDGARSEEASRATIAQMRDSLVAPDDPVAGDPNGDVTIVEFFDTRCPYCRTVEPVMNALLAQDKKVRLVFKDLPILGEGSVMGTKALIAAQKQGAYVRMREAVMKLPRDAGIDQVRDAALALGLDWPRMVKDMDDATVKTRIEANLALAHRLGVQGTPAFVIGNTMIPGAVDGAELKKAVAAARRS
jgi:protein-disulfide isomerase